MPILMAIDVGYTHPAFAIVQSEPLQYLFGETMVTERAEDRKSVILDDHRRISMISKWLRDAYDKFKPKVVVLELPTSGARSALAIKGMGFATALTIATVESYFTVDEIRLISPYDSKRFCCGDPMAEKGEIIAAVSKIFPNVQWPRLKKKDAIDPRRAEGIADSIAAILTFLKVGQAPVKKITTR